METIRQNLIAFGEKRGKPYAESSINTYLRNIVKLHERVWDEQEDGPMKEMENMDWALEPAFVEGALSKLKPTTQRNYYNALIIGLFAYPGPKSDEVRVIYEGRRDILNAEYDKSKGQPTEAQAKVMKEVNKETILKMLNKVPDYHTERMDKLVWLLFGIHTEYPFRNEMAKIQVIQAGQYTDDLPGKGKDNFILISKVGKGKRLQDHKLTFKLSDTKTAAKYGEKTIEVIGKVKAEMLKWIRDDVMGIMPMNTNLPIPTYLFTWATGKPLLRNDISHLMGKYSSKLIGHSVSTTLMAKIFNSIPEGNTATKEEIEKIKAKALVRGHSVKMSASVYNPNKIT